jgi:hypothetical protein
MQLLKNRTAWPELCAEIFRTGPPAEKQDRAASRAHFPIPIDNHKVTDELPAIQDLPNSQPSGHCWNGLNDRRMQF